MHAGTGFQPLSLTIICDDKSRAETCMSARSTLKMKNMIVVSVFYFLLFDIAHKAAERWSKMRFSR